MRCPNCGETAVREFGNEGGTLRECDACDWWEWEPPEPSVDELLERHRERYDGW